MAATQFSQTLVSVGLTTVSTTIPTAGPLALKVKLSLPQLSTGTQASACVVTINQNGSPVYTGIAGASGAETDLTTAVGDVVAIVFSSAAAVDQATNVIKAVISMSTGE